MKEIPLRDWGNLRRDGEYHLVERNLSTPGNKIAVVFREEPDAFPVAVRVIENFEGRPDGCHLALDGKQYNGDEGMTELCLDLLNTSAPPGSAPFSYVFIPRDARPYEEALAEIEAEAVEEAKDVPLLDWGDLEPGFRYHLEVQMLPDPERFAVLFRRAKLDAVVGVRLVDRGVTNFDRRKEKFIKDPQCVTMDLCFKSEVCLDFDTGTDHPYRFLSAKAPALEEARAEWAGEEANASPDLAAVCVGDNLWEWGDLDRTKPLGYYRVETAALPGRKVQLMFLTPDGEYVAGRVVEDHTRDACSLVSSEIEIHLSGSGGGPKLRIEFCGKNNKFIARRSVSIEVGAEATKKVQGASEPAKDQQPESATTSTQNHPVNVPLCDWGTLEKGKSYDLERHDISSEELAIIFREPEGGDVVAVRMVNPKPHDFYTTSVEPDHLARFDRSLRDVDFFCQGGDPVSWRRVSLDAPSLTDLAERNQLPDPKDETRWAYTKPELLPPGSEDQKIAGLDVAHMIKDEVQYMPPKAAEEIRGQIYGQRISATDFDRDSVLEAITSASAMERRYALWRQEISKSINRTSLNKPASDPAISEEALAEKLAEKLGEVVRAELEGFRVALIDRDRSTIHGDVRVEGIPAGWNGDLCTVHGDITTTHTDLDAVREIVEAVVHESTMDNSRSAASLQQYLCRIENAQAAMESELLKVSNFLTSLQESSVGLAGAMQDMADSGAALCDTVGARLSPIEATAGGVQSNQEALAKLSSDIEDFLDEVREQIVHLEAKIEDVQDAVWHSQPGMWGGEEALAQSCPHLPATTRYSIESYGRPGETRIVDLVTGNPLPNVKSVTWSVDGHGIPMAIIEVYDAALTANLPEEQVELIKLPSPGGYPMPEESKEGTTPNVIPEPDAAVNKSRFFSMEWRSDSQAKASGRGAMWLMAALLFGALIGGMLMNMFPLWRSASSGLSSWSAPAPSPRPVPAPSIQAKAAFPAKQEKSSSLLCR